MGRYRFVDPETVRLSLSDGDWIEVKRELNVGESNALFGDMLLGGFTPGEKTTYDPRKIGVARATAYLVAWSLTDRQGKPITLSAVAIVRMQGEDFNELIEVLDAHIAEQEARRAEEKKLRNSATSLRAV